MSIWEDAVKVLENPKYKWRTVRGVAKQLNYSQEEILQLLAKHENEIIKSSIPAESGEELYTTRRHYWEMTPFFDKVISSFAGIVTSSSSSTSSSSYSSSSSSSESSSSSSSESSSKD